MMESLTNDIYDEALKLITEVSKAGTYTYITERTYTYITERLVSLALSLLLVS